MVTVQPCEGFIDANLQKKKSNDLSGEVLVNLFNVYLAALIQKYLDPIVLPHWKFIRIVGNPEVRWIDCMDTAFALGIKKRNTKNMVDSFLW